MLVLGGGVNPGDCLGGTGAEGYYWSSVGRSSSRAYNLYFLSGNVYPSYSINRYRGFSVRCVALGD